MVIFCQPSVILAQGKFVSYGFRLVFGYHSFVFKVLVLNMKHSIYSFDNYSLKINNPTEQFCVYSFVKYTTHYVYTLFLIFGEKWKFLGKMLLIKLNTSTIYKIEKATHNLLWKLTVGSTNFKMVIFIIIFVLIKIMNLSQDLKAKTIGFL